MTQNNNHQNLKTSLLTGLLLFGGVASACSSDRTATDSRQVAATPSWKQTFKPLPANVEVGQGDAQPKAVEPAPPPTPIKKPEVELAIAHADEGVDYDAKARALMADGKRKQALVALRKHLHTAEATPGSLLVLGQLARQTKQYSLAEAALERGIQGDPNRVDLPVELARVHLAAGDGKKAERASRRAIRVARDDAPAWNQLGRAAMAQSRWELAEIAFGRSVHLDPVDGMTHNNFGLLYVYRKNGKKAVEHLERAVELLDEDAPYFVFNNLGLAHELSGQHEEARDAFAEALLLNPFYTRAKVNLDRVVKRLEAVDLESGFDTAKSVDMTAEVTEPDDA